MTDTQTLTVAPALADTETGCRLVVCGDEGAEGLAWSFVLDLDHRVMQLHGVVQHVVDMPSLYIGEPATILMGRPNGTGYAFNVPPVIAVYRY